MAKAKEYIGQEYATATQGKGLHQDSLAVRIITRVTVTFSVVVMLISIGIITCCAMFFLSPIIGTSMMTTLNPTGKDTDAAIACRVTTPNRGDIVISKIYQKQTKDYNNSNDADVKDRYPSLDFGGRYMLVIKRLIAVGGDQITMTRTPNGGHNSNNDYNYDYTIYLNGEKLDEPYLDPTIGKADARNFIQLYRILYYDYAGNDPLYQTNKNYTVTADWQATDRETVVKDGVLTIPEGYYFYLGDNRGGKLDTNPEWAYSWDCSQMGPLPADQYVGTCIDVVNNTTNMPGYVWDKIVYYVFFGWAWQK